MEAQQRQNQQGRSIDNIGPAAGASTSLLFVTLTQTNVCSFRYGDKKIILLMISVSEVNLCDN